MTARVGQLLEEVLARAPVEPAEFDAQEARVFLLLLRSLPFPVRCQLWRESRGGGTESRGMSTRSRRVARRFRLLALVRRSLEMKEV